MKNIFYIIAIFSLITYSCEDFDEYALQDLPGYVAFNAPGETSTIAAADVDENAGSVTFNIEVPTGTLSDITVSFSFGGSAVFGTDFTVASSSSSGGTIILDHDAGDVINFDNVDLVITILTDGVVDGDKTLTITLTDAVGADGTIFSVGRGGADISRTVTVNIADVD